MIKIRSYTSIWNVEKVIYSINDFKLPFPVTFMQITWFTISIILVILLGDLPPLSLIQGAFLKYLGIPVAITWFMSQKTFDNKRPISFCKSAIAFALRPKVTNMGKAIKLQSTKTQEDYTYVEGGFLNEISH